MTQEVIQGAPLVVGILGGVASGKSTVARLLGELGAKVIDADRLAMQVLERPAGVEAVRGAFGEAVFAGDGTIDRAALARIVFADADKLAALTRIVHPPVVEEVRSLLGKMDSSEIAVLDVPLLIESPFVEDCDLVVFVETALPIRERRARQSRGWSSAEIPRREGHQAPLEEKKRRAHLTVRNDGSLEDARRQVTGIWNEIVKRGRRERGSGPSTGPVGRARSAGTAEAEPRSPQRSRQPKEVEDG